MSKRTIIPIGPYHALQEEPEFFKLHVEGEESFAAVFNSDMDEEFAGKFSSFETE